MEPQAGRADYQIEDVCLLADTVSVTSDVQEKYNNHLLSGGNLPIAISTWSTTRHNLPANPTNFEVQTTRALSMLRTVFVTFFGPTRGTTPENTPRKPNQIPSTHFLTPQGDTVVNLNGADTIEWQLHIGARVWPVMPSRGSYQTFYYLRQALDQSKWGELNISRNAWYTDGFIVAIDTEKAAGTMSGANFTGHPCRTGEPVSMVFRQALLTIAPTEAYMTLLHDVIINIGASGVDVLE
jgi:hypothetical protein